MTVSVSNLRRPPLDEQLQLIQFVAVLVVDEGEHNARLLVLADVHRELLVLLIDQACLSTGVGVPARPSPRGAPSPPAARPGRARCLCPRCSRFASGYTRVCTRFAGCDRPSGFDLYAVGLNRRHLARGMVTIGPPLGGCCIMASTSSRSLNIHCSRRVLRAQPDIGKAQTAIGGTAGQPRVALGSLAPLQRPLAQGPAKGQHREDVTTGAHATGAGSPQRGHAGRRRPVPRPAVTLISGRAGPAHRTKQHFAGKEQGAHNRASCHASLGRF